MRLTNWTVKNCYLYQAQGAYNSGMLDIALYVTSMRHTIYRGYIKFLQSNLEFTKFNLRFRDSLMSNNPLTMARPLDCAPPRREKLGPRELRSCLSSERSPDFLSTAGSRNRDGKITTKTRTQIPPPCTTTDYSNCCW